MEGTKITKLVKVADYQLETLLGVGTSLFTQALSEKLNLPGTKKLTNAHV